LSEIILVIFKYTVYTYIYLEHVAIFEPDRECKWITRLIRQRRSLINLALSRERARIDPV